jgi:putative ABC transport system substrate-binding protein
VYDVVVWGYLKTAAEQAGMQLERIDLRSPDDMEGAFANIASSRPDALVNAQNPLLLPVRDRFASLALQQRLPCISGQREYTAAGLLTSYGANYPTISRPVATYVDTILKGARPADLPVEQPTVFDLVVNVSTLNALGLTIPASVLPLVTEWLQ